MSETSPESARPQSPSPPAARHLPRLAIIVPTLNEERQIENRLARLVGLADEVIVSDGGSSDRTRAMARALGAQVVTGDPGRGLQLNRGAAASDAEILLFVHADTELEPEAVAAVRRAVAAGGVAGGGLLCRFDHPRPIYRLGERIVNLRTRLTRAPLGDQAQFATREAFEALGGFRDWPLLEDLDFIRRLRKQGRLAIVGPPALTSARRYEKRGITRTIAVNWLIVGLFLLGVSPRRLHRLYR